MGAREQLLAPSVEDGVGAGGQDKALNYSDVV